VATSRDGEVTQRPKEDAFRPSNLHWHDLRHDYASRLVEHGVPLGQVRDLLGHASITTTERHDDQTLENQQLARRSEGRERKRLDASPRASDARTKRHKDSGDGTRKEGQIARRN